MSKLPLFRDEWRIVDLGDNTTLLLWWVREERQSEDLVVKEHACEQESEAGELHE